MTNCSSANINDMESQQDLRTTLSFSPSTFQFHEAMSTNIHHPCFSPTPLPSFMYPPTCLIWGPIKPLHFSPTFPSYSFFGIKCTPSLQFLPTPLYTPHCYLVYSSCTPPPIPVISSPSFPSHFSIGGSHVSLPMQNSYGDLQFYTKWFSGSLSCKFVVASLLLVPHKEHPIPVCKVVGVRRGTQPLLKVVSVSNGHAFSCKTIDVSKGTQLS